MSNYSYLQQLVVELRFWYPLATPNRFGFSIISVHSSYHSQTSLFIITLDEYYSYQITATVDTNSF